MKKTFEDLAVDASLFLISGAVVVVFFLSYFIVRQWEKGALIRLGKIVKIEEHAGLHFKIPFIDTLYVVDMRMQTVQLEGQTTIKKDNISVSIDAVVFTKVEDPEKVILQIEDYKDAVAKYAQTSIRDVMGKYTLARALISYNWSLENTFNRRSAGAGGGGRVGAKPFELEKMYDKSSHKLFLYCYNGKLIPHATLEVVKPLADENTYVALEYQFDNVIIVSYHTPGDINRYPGLLDEFSITFGKVHLTYTSLSLSGVPDGQVEATWDFMGNRGS